VALDICGIISDETYEAKWTIISTVRSLRLVFTGRWLKCPQMIKEYACLDRASEFRHWDMPL
jgi:hypothetical protein